MRRGSLIALTPFEPKDSPLLFRWINEREQVLLNSLYRPVHQGAHDSWFEDIQRRANVAIFAIRLATDGRLIGTCQLHDIHPVHRTAELQIRIGDVTQRGAGKGTEAVRLLLDFAFSDLNLNRIYLHVFEENSAALRSYEKAGFVREGVLRQAAYVDGQYRNLVLMSLLRGERGPTS